MKWGSSARSSGQRAITIRHFSELYQGDFVNGRARRAVQSYGNKCDTAVSGQRHDLGTILIRSKEKGSTPKELVPGGGVEPPRAEARRILSESRLVTVNISTVRWSASDAIPINRQLLLIALHA